MAHKSKALPSSDAPKACSGVTSIIKGCYHSHLHWNMGLQFTSKIKKGGDESATPAEILARDPRARRIYGAVLQSGAGSHKPGKDIFKSNHFLCKCPHKKNSSANSRALWKKSSALCTQYFWKYCTSSS